MKPHKLFATLALIAVLLLTGCSGVSAALQPLQSLVPPASVFQSVQPAQAAQSSASTAVPPAQAQATAIPSTGSIPSSGHLADMESTFEAIYADVSPSVVNIQVTIGASNTSNFSNGNNPFGFNNPGNGFGNGSSGASMAEGSGFVWDNAGHIVTNNHVVAGATKITVTFSDGTTVDASVVGADPNADLAVIKVNAPVNLLVPVTVADSKQVKVGQIVVAIGNPFGLQGTMTEGIVSALQRSLPVGLDNQTTQSTPSYSIPDIIQTDAAINPGNSGGVLVDEQGHLVGVTAAIESAAQSNSGIGFVIPSSIVQKVVPALIQNGHYDHPWLGISGTDMTPDIAQAMSLPASQRGVMVVDITTGGPAANAGIHGSPNSNSQTPAGGDVITAINGQPVKQFTDLSSYLFYNTQAGQNVTLTILRNGQQKNVQVTLGILPAQ